jgi:hypothetical protein
MMRGPTVVTLLLILLCLGPLLPRTTVAQGARYALSVKNGTGRDFLRLHVAWSRDRQWGPNILQSALRPNAEVVQRNMVPSEYDLLLVDSNGAQCTLKNVQVYNDKAVIVAEVNCR